jgi:hypothetical protein
LFWFCRYSYRIININRFTGGKCGLPILHETGHMQRRQNFVVFLYDYGNLVNFWQRLYALLPVLYQVGVNNGYTGERGFI